MDVVGAGATVGVGEAAMGDVSVELIKEDVITEDVVIVEDTEGVVTIRLVVEDRLVAGDGLSDVVVETALGLLEAARKCYKLHQKPRLPVHRTVSRRTRKEKRTHR